MGTQWRTAKDFAGRQGLEQNSVWATPLEKRGHNVTSNETVTPEFLLTWLKRPREESNWVSNQSQKHNFYDTHNKNHGAFGQY